MTDLIFATIQTVSVFGVIGIVLGAISIIAAFVAAADYEDGIVVAFFGVLGLLLVGAGVYGVLYGNYLNRVV